MRSQWLQQKQNVFQKETTVNNHENSFLNMDVPF